MFYVMSYYSTNLHTYLPIILFGKKSSAYHAGLATLAPNVGNEDREMLNWGKIFVLFQNIQSCVRGRLVGWKRGNRERLNISD